METTKLFELKKLQTDFPCVQIRNSFDAYDFIRNFYGDDIEVFESFFLLLLDRANKTIGYAKISQGGVCATYVDVKIIAKYAVDSLCSSVILAHNHPSGNRQPSEADIQLTKKIESGLKILDISVHDHIILTKNNFYSLKENFDF